MEVASLIFNSQVQFVAPVVIGGILSGGHYFHSDDHCGENDIARYFFASFTIITGLLVLLETFLKPEFFSSSPIHRLFSGFGAIVMMKFGVENLIEAIPKELDFNEKN